MCYNLIFKICFQETTGQEVGVLSDSSSDSSSDCNSSDSDSDSSSRCNNDNSRKPQPVNGNNLYNICNYVLQSEQFKTDP